MCYRPLIAAKATIGLEATAEAIVEAIRTTAPIPVSTAT